MNDFYYLTAALSLFLWFANLYLLVKIRIQIRTLLDNQHVLRSFTVQSTLTQFQLTCYLASFCLILLSDKTEVLANFAQLCCDFCTFAVMLWLVALENIAVKRAILFQMRTESKRESLLAQQHVRLTVYSSMPGEESEKFQRQNSASEHSDDY